VLDPRVGLGTWGATVRPPGFGVRRFIAAFGNVANPWAKVAARTGVLLLPFKAPMNPALYTHFCLTFSLSGHPQVMS
jgi:hypothetical protein